MHFLKKSRLLVFIILLVIVSASIFFYQGKEKERFIVFFSGAGMRVPVSEIVKDFTDSTGIKVNVHFEGSAILRQYIETYGDADVFMSGDKANIDALMLDIMMPKKNGIAAYEEIIKMDPKIKALFMSGYAEEVLYRKGLTEKGLNLLSKPVSPNNILKSIREALNK